MKRITHALLGVFLGITTVANAQLKPSDALPLMSRGINIGNTMEAPNEGAWNAPIKEYYFDDIKNVGFNTVRIPINWWNHTSKNAPYTIDAAWLNRVEQVVDWGLARGLFIELNTHHETQLFSNFNTYLPMYVSIWTQIATRFKGKSDHLLFELLNEPHGAPTVANLNEFNTKVVKAIRSSNPTRLIVYSGNQWANSYNLINKDLVNPNPGDQYLMGYYHSYDPGGFGLNGTGTFGTAADKQGIWNRMQSVTDWTAKSGIHAYLGEFGAVSKGDLNSRFRYYACVVDYAITHNIPFQVWDNGGDFQVYNRGARKFNELKDILVHYYPKSTTNFTAKQAGGVVLNWENRATNATSILVQRKLTSADTYTTVATISANATTYTDNSAPAGTYYYRVITQINSNTEYYGYPQVITTTGGPSFAVSLSSDKSVLCSGHSAVLTANAIINSGTVTKVEFYEGNVLLSTKNTSPYTFTITNPTLGSHTYTAKATSSTGTVVTSSSANVSMFANPTTTIISPINNSIIIGNTINITASATGNGITSIEFYEGTNKIGQDASVPYSLTWTAPAVGTYKLSAKVIDANGCTSSSATTSVQTTTITGVEEEPEEKNLFYVYPNPFSNTLQVKTKTKFRYFIFDLKGQLIENGEGENATQLGANIEQSVYLLKLETEGKTQIVKITKQ